MSISKIGSIPLIGVSTEMMVMPGTFYKFKNDPEIIQDFLEKTGIMDKKLALIAMEDVKKRNLGPPDSIYAIGVVSVIEWDLEDSWIKIDGLYRAQRLEVSEEIGPSGTKFKVVNIGAIEDENHDWYFIENQDEIKAKLKIIKNLMSKLVSEAVDLDWYDCDGLKINLNVIDDVNSGDKDSVDKIIWSIAYQIPQVPSEDKQNFIESTSLPERINLCIKALSFCIKVIEMTKASIEIIPISTFRKISAARQPKKKRRVSINDGISDQNLSDDDIANIDDPELLKRWERYKKIKDTLSQDATKAITDDFGHLKNTGPGSAEWGLFINHLDCLLDIYSLISTPQEGDFSKTEYILDTSHYGLDKPKEKIHNYLATKRLNPKSKAPIMCFVGPPGVGKTSIAKAVAESLGLKFIRLSLGGVRDEADIRGHRQTYIGAIPGKIIQEIRRANVKNPVFLFDEVDKVSNDFRGDPSSALLEVLDPEQNYSFQDHYVGAPFDLSSVLFLCTANLESGIQPALLDRMNVINISGYTEYEKIEIAKKYLIPKQFKETGLANEGIKLVWPDNNQDKVIASIIGGYTREAGVRNLERQIHHIFSVWGRQYLKEVDDKRNSTLFFTEELVGKFLKTPPYAHERAEVTEVGEAIGLAWTPVGGDIMYIQAQLTPYIRGEKSLSQTGGLLEVFRQMNKNALTVAKNLLKDDKIAMDKLKDNLLHLSTPDGAISKDGPSAGIAMAVAIYSELTGKPVKPYLAMTGEVTVKGRVRAIGGIKEKILAAHRDGIKEIILPKTNKKDVEEKVSDDIRKDLIFHFVENIREVLPIAFQ